MCWMLAEGGCSLPMPPALASALCLPGWRFLMGSAADPALAAPAFAPPAEPVAWMGWLAQLEGLLLCGQPEVALAAIDEARDIPGIGALDGMTRQLAAGFALVLLGRHGEASPYLKQ